MGDRPISAVDDSGAGRGDPDSPSDETIRLDALPERESHSVHEAVPGGPAGQPPSQWDANTRDVSASTPRGPDPSTPAPPHTYTITTTTTPIVSVYCAATSTSSSSTHAFSSLPPSIVLELQHVCGPADTVKQQPSSAPPPASGRPHLLAAPAARSVTDLLTSASLNART